MPFERDGKPVKWRLETGLRDLLKAKTTSREWSGIQWIRVKEAEPPLPFGRIREASASRFGSGQTILHWTAETPPRQYCEEWWRLSVEVHTDTGTAPKDDVTLGDRIDQLFNDLFKTPAGWAELSAMGAYDVRQTDEGDSGDGEKGTYSVDVRTEQYTEPPPVPIAI